MMNHLLRDLLLCSHHHSVLCLPSLGSFAAGNETPLRVRACLLPMARPLVAPVAQLSLVILLPLLLVRPAASEEQRTAAKAPECTPAQMGHCVKVVVWEKEVARRGEAGGGIRAFPCLLDPVVFSRLRPARRKKAASLGH